MFKDINNAYQILSDPEKKARYDRFGDVDDDEDTYGDRSGAPPDFFEFMFRSGFFPRGFGGKGSGGFGSFPGFGGCYDGYYDDEDDFFDAGFSRTSGRHSKIGKLMSDLESTNIKTLNDAMDEILDFSEACIFACDHESLVEYEIVEILAEKLSGPWKTIPDVLRKALRCYALLSTEEELSEIFVEVDAHGILLAFLYDEAFDASIPLACTTLCNLAVYEDEVAHSLHKHTAKLIRRARTLLDRSMSSSKTKASKTQKDALCGIANVMASAIPHNDSSPVTLDSNSIDDLFNCMLVNNTTVQCATAQVFAVPPNPHSFCPLVISYYLSQVVLLGRRLLCGHAAVPLRHGEGF